MRFSSFQKLKFLSIKFTGKFRLTDESFKSDLPTDTLLKLSINVDGMLPNSIESNALSYAYRPIHVYLNHYPTLAKQQCKILTLEEEIYAPFLAVNPENKIRVSSCPVLCDCSIKWLFDAPKEWWMRVEAGDSSIGLQCDDQRSLYFYSDYDFRSCPKTNLLKYFVPETNLTTSDSSRSSPYASTEIVENKQLKEGETAKPSEEPSRSDDDLKLKDKTPTPVEPVDVNVNVDEPVIEAKVPEVVPVEQSVAPKEPSPSESIVPTPVESKEAETKARWIRH